MRHAQDMFSRSDLCVICDVEKKYAIASMFDVCFVISGEKKRDRKNSRTRR